MLAKVARVALACAALACQPSSAEPRFSVAGGVASRAPDAIAQYGCGSCHVIPGVSGANGRVGPPLTDFGDRAYIAGRARNEPEILVRWLLVPQSIDPETVMPPTGLSDSEARDIAAYLYTLTSDRLGPPHLLPRSWLPTH